MLNCATDTDRNIKPRRNNFAGLPNLHIVGRIAGINRRARGASTRFQFVGQIINELEIIGAAKGSATANDNRCALQIRALAAACFQADKARVTGERNVDRHRFNRRTASATANSGK